MIQRHSSHRQPLDAAFLNARLGNARGYDRIAGYFSSSILEVAGEALETVQGPIRVVCNSQLSRADVDVAKLAQAAMRREWCESRPEALGENARPRFQRLYDFLRSGKLEVRVLPDDAFGLIHGKAGVVTLASGKRTAFLGSANESKTAFRLNYELVWEDDSAESVAWVQAEFDALWQSPFAVPLADFVVQDLDRLSRRELIGEIQRWRDEPEPASVVVEAPVYRREVGLWEHQKHFVKLAFDAHRGPFGARFVLADQVGLGKTLQLAMAAQLMALVGEKPVLVLAPKPLLRQWQEEMDTLLGLPSAIWTGRLWLDERGVEHPGVGAEAIRHCPRRIGIVSTSAITSNADVVAHLEAMRFECVILDEAHRARRRRVGQRPYAVAEPNNLLRFLRAISPRTKSLLLATATPVQLHPVEAYDLLDALAEGSPAVLGVPGSPWRDPAKSLPVLLGRDEATTDFHERWDWLRNPFPPAEEGRDFEILRRSLELDDAQAYAPGNAVESLRPADRDRVSDVFPRFLESHNPYIRAIVLRTREYLENTVDPETGEPHLARVGVRLHEKRPVSGASMADLDRRRLVDYFRRVRDQDVPNDEPSEEWRRETETWAKQEAEKGWRSLAADREQEWRTTQEAAWQSLLVNIELLHEEEPHSTTVAALMLFGRNPDRFLPHAKIDAAAYFGKEKDYEAKERCTLRGPILPLQGVDGSVLEAGLVEQAMDFVERNIATVRLADNVRREERWEFPQDAVRETIVNAIVHRDYHLSGTDIELSIYADRLEVVSPGRLANGVTPERMRVGCRSVRNVILKDVMRDYGYLEHMGMGVRRKIVRGMLEHNGTDPDLVAEDEQFTVVLWKAPRD